MLRHVEVLSCVSGGSIIGAHFYLEVRKLLQEKPDGGITREDYIKIVKRIETDFLEGVQTNVRTRVIAGWWFQREDDLPFTLLAYDARGRALREADLFPHQRPFGR